MFAVCLGAQSCHIGDAMLEATQCLTVFMLPLLVRPSVGNPRPRLGLARIKLDGAANANNKR
jgi:hypothetical protein